METQVQSFYPTPIGMRVITVFGYSTKGVPGLEINGLGKFGKNLKEKIIYLNRIRKIRIPVRRIVISVDVNELEGNIGADQLRWLEFPMLVLFWHLVGAVKALTLEDCACAGEVKVSGEVIHLQPPKDLAGNFPDDLRDGLKVIQKQPQEGLLHMDSKSFLENIPGLKFKTYIDRVSETPIKSAIA